MRDQWGRVDGLGWVDQGGSKPAPLCHGHGRGDGSPDPGTVPSRGLVEEDTMEPRRLTHTIRQIERILSRVLGGPDADRGRASVHRLRRHAPAGHLPRPPQSQGIWPVCLSDRGRTREERRRGPPHRDLRPGWLARLSPAMCGGCGAEPRGDVLRRLERRIPPAGPLLRGMRPRHRAASTRPGQPGGACVLWWRLVCWGTGPPEGAACGQDASVES